MGLASVAHATITLQSSITFHEEEGEAGFSGTVCNAGNQTAQDCFLSIETPFDEEPKRVSLEHLDPGVTNEWSLSYAHPEAAQKGTFAAVVRTQYADANGFALHAVQLFPYALGNPSEAQSPFRLKLEAPKRPIEGTELDGKSPLWEVTPLEHQMTCTIRLARKDVATAPPARIRVVLPSSLAAAWYVGAKVEPGPMGWTNALEIMCSPHGSGYATQMFAVTNLSALAGSKLSIGVIVSTEAEDGAPPTATTAVLQLPVSATPKELLPFTTESGALHKRPLPVWVPMGALLGFLLVELLWRLFSKNGQPSRRAEVWCEAAVFVFVYALLAYELRLDLVLKGALCLGGDTPAHHYLFTHLKTALAHGRIVSWAPGWWSGFPMYQFYFPLPYLGMVLLDVLLPQNVAFNVGLILGLFLTPLCTGLAARQLRLPRPAPALLMLVTVPLLLDSTHTMWGVNVASTLAGMISNSWSFAFFPLALSSTIRDVLEGRARIRTVGLLLAVLLSHFFTSIVLALLLVAMMPFLLGSMERAKWGSAIRAFVVDGALAVLLMAWWLVPLVATRPWSVDFGDPWSIQVWKNLPIFVKVVGLPSLGVAILGWGMRVRRKHERVPEMTRAMVLGLCQVGISGALFFWGYSISKVFVNCRLWPFMIHGVLVLTALVWARMLKGTKVPSLGAVVFGLFVMTFAWDPPNYSRGYAKWNFEGLEGRADAAVFWDLVERLKGTPGRFATDLHPDNESFGSTRAFEALPALNGKAIVEGGIVNSALGSLASYSVQGEVSDAPAGWPLRVIPRKMDVETGLKHLELMGVRHFLARSSHVQKRVEMNRNWVLVKDYGKWRLYENPSIDGALVRAYPTGLPVVESKDFQGAIVEWFQEPKLASTPQIVVKPGETVPCLKGSGLRSASVKSEESFHRIRFKTPYVGVPHLVAVSAFPNWKIRRGAERVVLATPGYMVVIPTAPEVELKFSATGMDWLGRALTVCGLVGMGLGKWMRMGRARRGLARREVAPR